MSEWTPCISRSTAQLVEGFQFLFVCLGGSPCREEDVHPAFGFERAQDFQAVVLVADLFQLLATVVRGEELDDGLGFGVLVALLGSRIEFPTQPGDVAGGANEKRRLFEESVVRDEAQSARFDVGRAVQRVHQKAVRALVERNGHGVDGEVTAAKVFLDGSGVNYGLAGLGILAAMGAYEVNSDGAGKAKVERMGSLIFAPDLGPRVFRWLFFSFRALP